MAADNNLGNDDEGESKKYFDPVTGEPISKNAHKKLLKGETSTKKEKKETIPKSESNVKKEKKVKEPEIIFEDQTPAGEKKILDGIFPPTYQPKYVEAAWQQCQSLQGSTMSKINQRRIDLSWLYHLQMLLVPYIWVMR